MYVDEDVSWVYWKTDIKVDLIKELLMQIEKPGARAIRCLREALHATFPKLLGKEN